MKYITMQSFFPNYREIAHVASNCLPINEKLG